jgi:phosphatidylserine decarboxylase
VITKPWHLRWMALALVLLCAGCAAAQTPTSHDGPATLELKRLMAANPEVKRLLIASIELARQVNPDRLTNPAQSLEQYYDFVS